MSKKKKIDKNKEKSVKSIMNPLSLFDDSDASGTPKTLTIVTKQKPDGPLLM